MENLQFTKYMNLLSNIKKELDNGKTLTNIRKELKGSGVMYTYLIKNNIIVKESYKGKTKWNEKIPVTYKLAETVYTAVSRAGKEYLNKKYSDLDKQRSKSTSFVQSNKSREFTLFWGLLKFKY